MLKRWVKRGLRALGYELVPISRFRELLAHQVQRNPDFTFVQVGANDGILFDNLYYFVTEHRCRGLVIEPLSDFFERLVLNYRHYPRVTPVRVAVHPTASSCRLYRVDPARQAEHPNWAAGIASLLPEHHRRFDGIERHMIGEDVPAMPLMRLLDDHKIESLDLLQVDTEGFDAEVLRMLDFKRLRPAIIKYEHVGLTAEDRDATQRTLLTQGYRTFAEGGDTIAVAG
jgi:FkbM family methyltransferase